MKRRQSVKKAMKIVFVNRCKKHARAGGNCKFHFKYCINALLQLEQRGRDSLNEKKRKNSVLENTLLILPLQCTLFNNVIKTCEKKSYKHTKGGKSLPP